MEVEGRRGRGEEVIGEEKDGGGIESAGRRLTWLTTRSNFS